MKDTIIKGTGNSRFLRSVPNIKNLYPTYDDFLAALAAGTFPVDLLGLNSSGVNQVGTSLNKANLLSDATASKLGLTGDATVDGALRALLASGPQNPYNWNAPKKLKNLPVGSLLKLNENGTPKKLIILGVDHYGSGTGVTLLRKGTFGYINYNGNTDDMYCNVYDGSTIDNFCNGTYPHMLDKDVQEFLINTPIVTLRQGGGSTLDVLYRKGFSLSLTELGITGYVGQVVEGTAFSYFSDDTKRTAYYDDTTYSMGDYWLRSPYSTSESYVFGSSIRIFRTWKYESATARPAINLFGDLPVTTSTDSDGCYNLLKKEDA